MATTLNPIAPLPSPSEPVIDVRTGRMTQNWYIWFKRLEEHMREAEARITALE